MSEWINEFKEKYDYEGELKALKAIVNWNMTNGASGQILFRSVFTLFQNLVPRQYAWVSKRWDGDRVRMEEEIKAVEQSADKNKPLTSRIIIESKKSRIYSTYALRLNRYVVQVIDKDNLALKRRGILRGSEMGIKENGDDVLEVQD